MSHAAIAAAMALEGVTAGERLVAFSLASFANTEHQAWPGTPAAAERAGLSRAHFLQSRQRVVRRGLLTIEDPSRGGRGRASTVNLTFARSGPWWDAEINVELFEAVLARSRARGSARLLLAAMAALSDGDGQLELVTTEELCAAAGIAHSTYRRACAALIATRAATLIDSTGGRGKANRWTIATPDLTPTRRPTRAAPAGGSIPIVVTVAANAKPAQSQTVSGRNQGETPLNPGRFLSETALNPRRFRGETPPQTPPETPPPNARAGREPQNPRTKEHPPSPPEGGSRGDSILINETHVTAHGRRRRRAVTVELSAIRSTLAEPTAVDERDWSEITTLIANTVGDTTFAIWIEPLELVARDTAHTLVVIAPPVMHGWLRSRFGRLMWSCAAQVGRELRLAEEAERAALADKPRHLGPTYPVPSMNQEAVRP